MNYIRLCNIEVNANSLTYHYEVSPSIKRFFKDYPYTLQYEIDGCPLDISGVPEGILSIPFVCNVLPVCWLTDSVLYLGEIDADFYESIPEFKKGYVDMFPDAVFAGRVEAEKITRSAPDTAGKSALFYSGGLDSSCTLARHYDEHPYLLSIWGSDIPADNPEGWKRLYGTISEDIKALGLNSIVIRSAFRKVIHEGELGREFSPVLKGDSWWHGAQHGIAIISHAAPCDYVLGVTRQYIAATHSPEYTIQCASDPTIDNYVRFSGCQVYHDAYITRQEKVRELVKFSHERNINIHLHVCWQTTDGGNCQMCEKCCRTIMGILAEGEDPNKFGFSVDDKVLAKCKRLCLYDIVYKRMLHHWLPIQDSFRKNKPHLTNSKYYKYMNWLDSFDFDRCDKYHLRRIIALKNRLRHKAGRLLRKLGLKK